MDWLEIWKLASPVIVGLLSVYFGSLFALKKFKKEKYWDEMRNAYNEVISAFEELLYWTEKTRADHYCEPSNSIEANPSKALREICKFSETGSLIFSKEFHKLIKEANDLIVKSRFQIHEESLGSSETEQDRQEWHVIQVAEIGNIASEYLPKLIDIARKELPSKT